MEKLYKHTERVDLIQNNVYYILDDKENEKTLFVNKNDDFDLEVDAKNNYVFIDNERYIMNISKEGIKKCDWIIFNSEKFYFIEAKNIIEKSYRKKAREDAYLKFEHTINFYKINFEFDYQIKRYALLNFRKNTNDISKASLKELKTKYKDILKLKYEESNFLEM